MEALAERTTVLVVAHRLSTVRAADRIAVLQDGRLRAMGTHDALVETDELYAPFVATQLCAGATGHSRGPSPVAV